MSWEVWGMISKTSFFNKGIYKSTLKRYKWGAFLYFVILFLINGMSILLSAKDRYAHLTRDEFIKRFTENSLIMRGDHLGASSIITLFIPTVVALLVFRFVHSKKAAVFTHSIPTTRKSNYISSLLGGLSLMALPIIANGIILAITSLCGYGEYFTVIDCLKWTGILLYIIFTMFSCAVFSAMITGNSFAAVAINFLVHSFIAFAVSGLSSFAHTFLYGYTDSNVIMDAIADGNFFVVGASLGSSQNFREGFSPITGAIYAGVSALIYYISYLLYKGRRLENAEEVAGFKCLNPIFKYSLTFLATVCAFAIMSNMLEESPVYSVLTIVVVSIITYFAIEMLLKKTFRVFKSSYKGYIGFALFFILMTSFFACTSFFGYETYVPKAEDIESSSVYSYYYTDTEPSTKDRELIKYVTQAHSEFAKNANIPILDGGYHETNIHFKYKLKNGREVHRIYRTINEKLNKIMNVMYENEDYKKASEPLFGHAEKAYEVELHINYQQYGRSAKIKPEEIGEFVKVVQDEVMSMSFDKLHDGGNNVINGYYDYDAPADGTTRTNVESYDEYGRRINRKHFSINANYKNTINWLIQKGYVEAATPLEKIIEK